MQNNKIACDCQDGWYGRVCDVPSPELSCQSDIMKVVIDKRLLVKDPNHVADNERIAFGDSTDEKCQAKLDGDNYVLIINSPFSQDNCGTIQSRDPENGNYIFSNVVMWSQTFNGKAGEAAIQRRHKVIDFKCNYEDEYLLHMKPLQPAESVIEKEISKGDFKVNMSLWKNSDFENDITGQYSDNPIIRIRQEVCVKIDLESNLDMSNLVLSASDCWASHTDNPEREEDKHYIIQKKCRSEDDYTSTIKKNGIDNEVKFCFQIYKWKQNMDQLFIQCKMNVCDDSVQYEGSSQCICPPQGWKANAWYYPNYYHQKFQNQNMKEYYNYPFYSDTDYLYGDDARSLMTQDNFYGNDNYGTLYYDYLPPTVPGAGGKRKKRSIDLANLPNPADYTPVKYNGDSQKKRKRYEFGGKLRDESGTLKLPEGLTVVPKTDMIGIGYGPIQIKEQLTQDPEALKQKTKDIGKIEVTRLTEDIEWFETEESANNVVLMAVGGALILAIIILGVVIGVYVQFRSNDKERALNQIDDQKRAKDFFKNVVQA